MKQKIEHISINGLFGDTNIEWAIPSHQDVTVLVGENGSGKSTILQAVRDAVLGYKANTKELYSLIDVKTDKKLYSYVSSQLVKDMKTSFSMMVQQIKDMNSPNYRDIEGKIKSIYSDIESLSRRELPYYDTLNKKNRLKSFNKLLMEDLFPQSDREEIKSKSKVTFISTIDLLANLSREFNASTGDRVNFFDVEVKNTYQKWYNISSVEQKSNFKTVLNTFLSNKTADIGESQILFNKNDGGRLALGDLSSGERQLVYILVAVAFAEADEHDLILMDEPEISLHLKWQKILLEEIRKINTYSQMIVVTHGPALIMNGWRDSYVDIKEIISSND